MKSRTARSYAKADVLTILREQADRLAALGVRRLGLFGSFVRDEAGRESDVDLLVEFDPERKTFDNFMAAAFLLEEALGRRVELLTRDALSPHIGPAILGEVENVPLGSRVPATHR